MEIVEETTTGGVLTIQDGQTKVLSYRFGDQLQQGVDEKYKRSCYIHPLWSLDEEIITDDFPADHFHHRGIYWAWPKVETRGIQSETWHPHEIQLRQHFVRWVQRSSDSEDGSAVIAAENKWLLRETDEVAKELVTIRAYPAKNNRRNIDIKIEMEAVGGPLTLQGTSEGKKGYGGFCFRGAPSFKGASIDTDAGPAKEDIVQEPRKWVALSTEDHGIAIFASPDHPDHPPRWMARKSYTGFINVSWPGMSPVTLEPGNPVTLEYRMVVFEGQAEPVLLQENYADYIQAQSATTTATAITAEMPL